MNKIIGIVLIAGSLFLGYQGINKISSNKASLKVLDVEVGVSNESEVTQGYLFLGAAVVLFGSGIYLARKK